tara:strand:+ start:1550 stop:1807 length:258 start_codon:yes stop_codon:yes gene_type:complete
MFYISRRYSAAVDVIAVNPFTKVAVIRYTNGREYTYNNVSRRRIINLMLNPNMSLGFWANKTKRQNKVACTETGFNVSTNAMLTT